MGVLGQSAGLLFKIEADSSDAVKDLSKVDGAISSLGNKMGSFTGMASVAGAAVGTLASAVIGFGAALFDITKQAAEYGSTIFDATEKTGLAAETISSLKVAADQSGSSLETVTKAVAKFAKGFEGSAGDLEKELGKVFKQIYETRSGIDQLKLAQEKFGKSGAELIPVINATGGNLDEFKKKCEELGLTIDGKAAAAADAFGDQMDTLSAQFAGVGRTIGTALMPQLTQLAGYLSNWLAQNKTEVSEFAARIGAAFSNLIRGFEAVKAWIDRNGSYLRVAAAILTLGGSEAALAGARGIGNLLDTMTRPGPPGSQEGSGGSGGYIYDADPTKAGKSGPRGKTAEQLEREEEQRRQKAFQARLAEIRRYENEYNAAAERLLAKAEMQLEQGKLDEQSFGDVKLAIAAKVAARKSYYLALELEAAEKFGQETADIESRMSIQRQKNASDSYKNVAEMYKKIGEARKEYEDALKEYEEDDKKRHKDWLERANEQITFLEKMRAEAEDMWQDEEKKREKERQDKADKKKADYDASPMGQAVKSWKDLKAAMLSVVGIQNVMGGFFSMVIGMAQQMANAVGQSVEAWALYGESLGKSLRKALAAQLAHIAGVAIINALYATALGFLRLAQWDFAGAANAFISAGLWTAIAGGAALGARAIAGDSFKQQTDASTGKTSTAASGQGQGGGSGVYSSQKDTVVEVGRNDPGSRGLLGALQSHITLKIESTTAHIVDVVTQNIQGNGRLRTVIQDAT